MSDYSYIALKEGRRINGIVEANSLGEAQQKLSQQKLRILSLSRRRSWSFSFPEMIPLLMKYFPSLMMRSTHIETIFRQFASLLKGGVPILSALKLCAEQSPVSALRYVFTKTANRIQNGSAFFESFRDNAPFLDPVTLGLIAAGEKNGAIPNMLKFASSLMERRRHLKEKVIQALIYPAIVTLLAIAAGILFSTYAIPKLTEKLSSKPVTLPPITRWLIDVSEFIRLYGIYVVFAFFLMFVFFILLRQNRVIGRRIDQILIQLPLLGTILKLSANAVWCRTLGIMLQSGITIDMAMDLTAGTIKNIYIQSLIIKAKEAVCRGQPLSIGMDECGLNKISPFAVAMIKVGEQSGNMDEGLIESAEFAEDELDRKLSFFTKIFEPVLIIVVGVIVAFVYIAFFLGLMAVVKSLKR